MLVTLPVVQEHAACISGRVMHFITYMNEKSVNNTVESEHTR
jgi:hypothetical protein